MADSVVHFPVKLIRYHFRDEMTIPLRPWLMRGLLLRKQVACMLAQGGLGKSIFGLTIALHLAAGRDFGPFKCIGGRHRVAVLSVEEDADEIDRRLHAIARVYEFTNEDASNLFIIHAEDPIMASADRRGNVKATELSKEFERLMMRDVMDAFVADPFIETWFGNENDNAQVRAAAGVIRTICRRMDAACLLTHHVRKGSVTPGDIDSGRGASSLSGLVRLAYTMTPMSKDDAATLNIPSPKGIVRLDHAKGNYMPPPETATWLKFRNVELHNADPETERSGDHVGVLVPWSPPGLFEGITYEKIDQILDAIAGGIDGLERYTLAPQSKDRYVGKVIAEVGEITEERAARITLIWKKSGLLYEEDYLSGAQRRMRKGILVDVEKRPSAMTET